MKKIIPLIIFIFTTLGLFAQCDELFISEYVEGGNNNKAIELYNPTDAAIQLSDYSVGRYSNGGTSYVGIDIPAAMIEPYGTYVIVLDKRDPNGTGNEYPVWDGYQEWGVCIVNGEPIINMAGDTVYCVQVDTMNNNQPLYGTVYRDFLDLQGKADVFLCPVYNVNNAMYFNGNDAVVLVKGSTVNGDGSNLIDVVGVIGDPAMASNQSWVDASGGFLTRDRTLERKSNIQMGTGIVADALQDTFAYVQYNVWGKNNFYGLGDHDCECDPDFMSSNVNLNQIQFNIYPNPTSEELWIEAEENIERIEIYNLLGERVITRIIGTDASNKTNILVGELDHGMYVISLFFDNDFQSTQKFIKR